MPLTRVMRRGGTTVMVEAHAEVLFGRAAPIGRWTARFTQQIEHFVRDFSPVNSRPRWAHSGPRLKTTFDSATQPNPAGLEVGFAVGSSSDHALYVNDGTGIYAGRSPYRAKILPPWHRGEPSLYEHTWRPGGRARVRDVWIRGQKGQHFFERGLERAFQAMMMRSYQLPEDPKPSSAAQLMATQKLEGFLGGFKASSAFQGELEQWRAWRDRRWGAGGTLGPGARTRSRRGLERHKPRPYAGRFRRPRRVSEEQKRANAAARAKRYRENLKKNGRKPDRTKAQARAREKQTVIAALNKRFGAANVEYYTFERGQWVFTIRVGRSYRTLRVTPKT